MNQRLSNTYQRNYEYPTLMLVELIGINVNCPVQPYEQLIMPNPYYLVHLYISSKYMVELLLDCMVTLASWVIHIFNMWSFPVLIFNLIVELEADFYFLTAVKWFKLF